MIHGIFGRPIFDLDAVLGAVIDLNRLETIHDEVCVALARTTDLEYTGGSHRSMGIMPEERKKEALTDYGEILASMSKDEFYVLAALADQPEQWNPDDRGEVTYGEERDHLLNQRQMRWLEVRYGVYFPWKTYIELMPGGRWADKSNPKGKQFTREAQRLFPKTCTFIRELPFQSIGSVKLLGVNPFDYGTTHRDREGKDAERQDHFITVCPKKNKRLYVYDADTKESHEAKSRSYWFNDADYHGVQPDPFFRYSIRVDGTFKPEFLARIEASLRT